MTKLSPLSKKQEGEMRRLQVTGGSTYIVSLPKKWVTKNQLKKGSLLLISEEENGSLAVSSQNALTTEKSAGDALIKVSSNDNPNTIVRKTVSAYLVGYNMIRMKTQEHQQMTSKQRNTIKDFARRLLVGTEIVTDTPTELILQVLLSYPELSIQSALRRMCIITSSMHKDALTALKELDSQLAKGVVATDDEVDRFNLYVVRQLKVAIQNPRIIREIGLKNARDCLGYRQVTKSVERVADHAASIAENVLLLKKPIDEEILKNVEEMSNIAVSLFETAIDSLFRLDFNLAESVIQKTKDVSFPMKEALLSSKKVGTEEVANLRLVIESLRRTAEYASDIAEIVLNMTVETIVE
ncbi:MAG: phosphate uptake regulator PhoU [Candidatus Bathyarchaeia archaeon]|jgi:phosphate uptake regulator